MACELYIDIGDVSTKFACLPEGHGKMQLLKAGSFISCAAPWPGSLPDFLDFEERVFSSHPGLEYLVGWPAALTGEEAVGLNLCDRRLRAIFDRILFENLKDGQDGEIYLAFDFGQKAHRIRQLAKSLDGKSVRLYSRHLYSDDVDCKTVRLKIRLIAGPLCLFDHLVKTAGCSQSRESGAVAACEAGGCSALIVDFGYTRTKIFIVSLKRGLECFRVLDAAVCIHCDKVVSHFKQLGHNVNKYFVMKELELSFPYVTVNGEKYSVAHIFQNVQWDLNKEILRSILKILTNHYNRTGRWVKALALVGGGAVSQAHLLCASIAGKNYTFDRVIFDKLPRYSVLAGMIHGVKR